MVQLRIVRDDTVDLILYIRTEQSTEVATPRFLAFSLVFLAGGNGTAHVIGHVRHVMMTQTCPMMIVTVH